MALSQAFLIALIISGSAIVFDKIDVVDANIVQSMYINWRNNEAVIVGSDDLQLALDQTSGSGAVSKRTFLFGSFEMLIKLVPGNSAGTITAYYLSSDGSKRDEIDFEFLGNVSGQPYVVHTNIYTQGNDSSREQQFYVWWYIDSVPIRVFRNYQNKGIAYPNEQGMRVYASIWDGDNWATEGGRIKINWANAPFIAKFAQFRPRACY
ncbi:hypothetical protein SO802_002614 [Lithocarpus litseifolius]|uniref:GH16 domain-containing protein n=1 Tax=Lithocarpus litseifolius TaxID=425828 RepID=A0AAW2E1R5_9ROSI